MGKHFIPSLYIPVKLAIIKCNEKIKSASEKYKNTSEELDRKVRLFNRCLPVCFYALFADDV